MHNVYDTGSLFEVNIFSWLFQEETVGNVDVVAYVDNAMQSLWYQ